MKSRLQKNLENPRDPGIHCLCTHDHAMMKSTHTTCSCGNVLEPDEDMCLDCYLKLVRSEPWD